MSLKNILVAFNGTESSLAAVAAAEQMHRKHGCHVTGIYAHSSRIERLRDEDWVPQNLRSLIGSLVTGDESRMESGFRAAAAWIPSSRLHWISQQGRPDATVAHYGQMFDLIVTGRRDALRAAPGTELQPGRIAMASGRPVLIIPRGWAPPRIHEHAVLAWDGNRAATRALAEAMQILETKQKARYCASATAISARRCRASALRRRWPATVWTSAP